MRDSLSLIFAFLAIMAASRVRKFSSGLKAVSKRPEPWALRNSRSTDTYDMVESWGELSLGQQVLRYADVWSRTIQAYHDTIAAEGWHELNVVGIPIVQKFTFKARPPVHLGTA
ncbi:hypothetical protein PTI98_007301 [Pleurotus ostreatus]|nr:hypothetical protein PTI98_007301 [Pleurotus ostreatus]